MPRAIDGMIGGSGPGKHIDAYQEYSQLVGRLDGGRPLPGPVYEELRKKAANPSRRLYVNWRNSQGLDCRAVGPQSPCFCSHRYNEHEWDAFESRQLRCKMPGCPCTCFEYVPARGSQALICSSCHRPHTEHGPRDRRCPTGERRFASSYTCSCTETYMQHRTVVESRGEREREGRPVDAGWMEQAAKEGLPVCHLGGIIGFTSLADGVDRALAGLEGGGESAGGASASDAGASRWMQRMQLEDEVNTAAALHGRAAGQRKLVEVKARQRQQPGLPGPIAGSARPSRAASASSALGGPRGSGSPQLPPPPPHANVHSLGDRPLLTAAAAVSSPAGRGIAAAAARRSAGAGGPTPGRARSSHAAPAGSSPPPAPGSASRQSGRRVGGVRAAGPEAMRMARLAHFEG